MTTSQTWLAIALKMPHISRFAISMTLNRQVHPQKEASHTFYVHCGFQEQQERRLLEHCLQVCWRSMRSRASRLLELGVVKQQDPMSSAGSKDNAVVSIQARAAHFCKVRQLRGKSGSRGQLQR